MPACVQRSGAALPCCVLRRALTQVHHLRPVWSSHCWLRDVSNSAPRICSLALNCGFRAFKKTLCAQCHNTVKESKTQQVRGAKTLGTKSCCGCSSFLSNSGTLAGHKYPPPLLGTSALPGGDTSAAQLPLDLSRLLGHTLCPAAQLHPEPVLAPLPHTPTALQAAPLSKGVRCQTFGRCSGLARYHLPCWHLGPRLALPREQENLDAHRHHCFAQPQTQRAQ